MGTTPAGWAHGRLTPGIAAAAAAGAAGLFAAGGALLLSRLAPALLAPFLALFPLLGAAAAWLAVRAALRPAVAMVERLAAHDFSASGAGDGDGDALAAALERCRQSLAARDRTMRAHMAVAKLMGAGVDRLAQGDFTARIDADLPAPYDRFGRDFNAAMERLAADADALSALRDTARDAIGALEDAAARLGKRAEKLGMRIETDLRIIDVLGKRDAGEALAIARHTMEGVAVAARRNSEAAAEIARIAEALPGGRVDAVVNGKSEAEPAPAGGEELAA